MAAPFATIDENIVINVKRKAYFLFGLGLWINMYGFYLSERGFYNMRGKLRFMTFESMFILFVFFYGAVQDILR